MNWKGFGRKWWWIIKVIARYLSTETEKTHENNEKPQTRTMTRQRFEPDISRKQV
jgi:hypothetical protein